MLHTSTLVDLTDFGGCSSELPWELSVRPEASDMMTSMPRLDSERLRGQLPLSAQLSVVAVIFDKPSYVNYTLLKWSSFFSSTSTTVRLAQCRNPCSFREQPDVLRYLGLREFHIFISARVAFNVITLFSLSMQSGIIAKDGIIA